MNILIGVGLIVLVVSTLVMSFVSISRDAQRIHERLHEFRARAEKASVPELRAMRHELAVFHDEACYHRHFSAHAQRVLAYIDGRLDGAGGAS